MEKIPSLKLNDGNKMPILGLGVWQIPEGAQCVTAIKHAFDAGYRHIDSASIYGNEKSVGTATKLSAIPRDELFITTKLWNSDHRNVEKALEKSLKNLELDYVDLYLIHWPASERIKTWKIFEKFVKEGKCRSIGVSNFTIRHLEELMASSSAVPCVNQVEFNPFLHQKDLLDFCRKEKIQLEAYSPLMHGNKLENQRLLEIASRYGKSAAQICLRWAVQKEVVAIPKSRTKERIIENSLIFDFSIKQKDIDELNSLDEGYRTCWDPTDMP